MLTSTLLILMVLIQIHFITTDSDCLNLDVTVMQKVESEGFHREIRWLVETQSPSKEKWIDSACKMVLKLDISSGMYVYPEEVLELSHTRRLLVHIDGNVDIEAPAHQATEHTVYIYLNSTSIDRISVNLPIHIRYQRGQITGRYGKIHLKKPSLLVWCPDSLSKICGRGLKVEAPFNVMAKNMSLWKNLTYQALFDEAELFVPVGDLDDYPVVSIMTLLLGCTSCIYILTILSVMPL